MATTEPKWYMDLTWQKAQGVGSTIVADTGSSNDQWSYVWQSPNVDYVITRESSDNWLQCKDTEWVRAHGANSTLSVACDYALTDDATGIFCASQLPYSSFVFNDNNNKPLVTINHDGTVELGEAASSVEDAASAAFWQAFKACGHVNTFPQTAGLILEELRIILGVPDGESITEHAKLLMQQISDGAVMTPDPIQVAEDPAMAYARAMKVV